MRNVRTKVGLIMSTVLPLLAGITETRACLGHLVQDPWPAHALFHAMMGLGGLLTAYGLIIVLTWGPLKRGERWAWYSIGVAAFGLYGTMLLSDAVTGGGLRNQQGIVGSGANLWRGIWVILILYAVALALTWRHTGLDTSSGHRSGESAV